MPVVCRRCSCTGCVNRSIFSQASQFSPHCQIRVGPGFSVFLVAKGCVEDFGKGVEGWKGVSGLLRVTGVGGRSQRVCGVRCSAGAGGGGATEGGWVRMF